MLSPFHVSRLVGAGIGELRRIPPSPCCSNARRGDSRVASAPNAIHFHPPGGLLLPGHGQPRTTAMNLSHRLVAHDRWHTARLLEQAASLSDARRPPHPTSRGIEASWRSSIQRGIDSEPGGYRFHHAVGPFGFLPVVHGHLVGVAEHAEGNDMVSSAVLVTQMRPPHGFRAGRLVHMRSVSRISPALSVLAYAMTWATRSTLRARELSEVGPSQESPLRTHSPIRHTQVRDGELRRDVVEDGVVRRGTVGARVTAHAAGAGRGHRA